MVWICHLTPTHPYWENSKDIPFTKTVRGAPEPLKNYVIVLLCGPELTVGTSVTELGNLNAVGVFRSPDGQSKVAAYNHQRHGQPVYSNGEQSQSTNQNRLTWAALWFYLVAHDLPRSKRVRKPSKFLLDMYKQRCHQSNEQKSILNHKNRKSQSFDQSPDLSH